MTALVLATLKNDPGAKGVTSKLGTDEWCGYFSTVVSMKLSS